MSGIVQTARRRLITGSNLTRAEARLTTTVLLEGADASDRARIEIAALGSDPADAPLAAGRAGEPLGLPPGRYVVRIRLREARTAEGQGAIVGVVLPPAGDVTLLVNTRFETGTLLVRSFNHGVPVDQRTRLTITPASGGPAHQVTSGAGLRLAAGRYDVVAVWSAEHGAKHTIRRELKLEAGRIEAIDLDFAVAVGTLRVRVSDPDGNDLTANSRIRLQRPDPDSRGAEVLEAAADLDHPLAAGRYRLTVTWSAPPFARASATIEEVTVTAGGVTTVIPVKLPARTGRLTFDAAGVGAHSACKVTLRRSPGGKPATADGLGPFVIPAGTWDAVVECAGARRKVPGLIISPGQTLSRRLVFKQ